VTSITLNKQNRYLYPAYTTLPIKAGNHGNNVQSQISFEGTKKSLLIATLGLLGLFFAESIPLGNYKPEISKKIEWPENVQVLASGSQRHMTFSLGNEDMNNYNTRIDGYYSNELIAKLKQGKAKNFYEAHKLLKTGGLNRGQKLSCGAEMPFSQFPVETPHNLNSWNINDKTKNRIVLAIGGSEKRSKRGLKGFCSEISKIYSIEPENMIQIVNANTVSVREGLKKLAEKLKLADKTNTEVLIYYHDHGSTTSIIPFADYFRDEGDAIGITGVGLDETDLKEFVRKNLEGINTQIIMDTCRSGAWIGENINLDGENLDYLA
jgi:hypothetical protein